MAECIYCKSEDVVFDELTGMCYCPTCNNMWDKNELDSEESSKTTDYEEELNGFSLLILSMLMMIPILDFIIASLISNSRVKEQYKKTFVYRCIFNIFLYLGIIVCIVLFLKESEAELKRVFFNTVDSIVGQMLPASNSESFDIPAVMSYEDLILNHMPEKDESDDKSLPQGIWKYVDNVTMPGTDAIMLVEDISDYDVIVLIRTEKMLERYENNSYRCLGIIPNNAYKNESADNWFYEGKLDSNFEFMTDDYGEYVTDDYKDMYSSKYIYYINPKSKFTIRLLLYSDDIVIGVALLEE